MNTNLWSKDRHSVYQFVGYITIIRPTGMRSLKKYFELFFFIIYLSVNAVMMHVPCTDIFFYQDMSLTTSVSPIPVPVRA